MGGRYQGVVGYVYFIYCPATDRFRIGWSKRDPDGRFILTNMYSSDPLEKFALMRGTHAHEQNLHLRFDKYLVKGEWFRGHESIREYIRENARPWQELLMEHHQKAMAGFNIPDPTREKSVRPPRKAGPGKPPTMKDIEPDPNRRHRYGPLQKMLDELAADKKRALLDQLAADRPAKPQPPSERVGPCPIETPR